MSHNSGQNLDGSLKDDGSSDGKKTIVGANDSKSESADKSDVPSQNRGNYISKAEDNFSVMINSSY